MDWLEACDSTFLSRDVYQYEKRSKLLSALAFATGWLPDDPKLSQLDTIVSKLFWIFMFFHCITSDYLK